MNLIKSFYWDCSCLNRWNPGWMLQDIDRRLIMRIVPDDWSGGVSVKSQLIINVIWDMQMIALALKTKIMIVYRAEYWTTNPSNSANCGMDRGMNTSISLCPMLKGTNRKSKEPVSTVEKLDNIWKDRRKSKGTKIHNFSVKSRDLVPQIKKPSRNRWTRNVVQKACQMHSGPLFATRSPL